MKNSKKFKRLFSFVIVVVMLISGSAAAVSASDQTAAPASADDTYSLWAEYDIVMAQKAYGLGNEITYSDFKGTLTKPKFETVIASFNEKFGTAGTLEVNDENSVTRGEVIEELYNIIAAALKLDGAKAPAESVEITETTDITANIPAMPGGGNSAANIISALLGKNNMGTAENKAEEDNALIPPYINYFIKNHLINGRADGDYQLDKICTVEEMIVFSVRTYEYVTQSLGLASKGFFWKVTGGDAKNTVYLLGSIHITDGSLYPLNKSIEDAFELSHNLVVEADVAGITEEESMYMAQKGIISDGSTIKDLLTPEVYSLYAEICEQYGFTSEMYDILQPWFASMLLNNMMLASSGAEDENFEDVNAQATLNALLGVDMRFLLKAGMKGERILELESIKFQVDMFASFSPDLQESMLVGTLLSGLEDDSTSKEEQVAAVQAQLLEMLEMWKDGDEVKLVEYLGMEGDLQSDDPLVQEYNTKMIIDRNNAMAENIIKYLTGSEDDGDYFVVVGAAHLIGETGLVKLLTDAGYTVERIK